MLINEPITIEKINEVYLINKEKEKTYGGPCNMLEKLSIDNHNKNFENIQKIISLYNKLFN